jgi:hypothetical protein
MTEPANDEAYYKQRFEALIAWLSACERGHEAAAELHLDASQLEYAQKELHAASMAKRARMWIRNHVSFSR